MTLQFDVNTVTTAFDTLASAYQLPEVWWPADDPFEIMLGAILTQNTTWSRVQTALAALREHGPLTAAALLALDPATIATCLRPTGYYNQKTQRLRDFCQHDLEMGGTAGWMALTTPKLRQRLLSIRGIGHETADDILLYACDRPVFVVDAYTRRLATRLGWLPSAPLPYDTVRLAFEAVRPHDFNSLRRDHALIIHHGQQHCRPRPRCDGCPLLAECVNHPESAQSGAVIAPPWRSPND